MKSRNPLFSASQTCTTTCRIGSQSTCTVRFIRSPLPCYLQRFGAKYTGHGKFA